MPATYRTAQGDVLDAICAKHYGTGVANPRRRGAVTWPDRGLVEAVFLANPGLAERGPVLPAGLDLILPDPPARAEAPRVQLWD